MATHKIVSKTKTEVGQVDLPGDAFGVEVKEHVLHEVVVNQLANRRAGTHKSKTRAEVSGGGTKPWRQKGTGRARSGSNTSPLWRRGGSIHGPKPRSYAYGLPRKVRKQALAMALSLKAKEGALLVVDSLAMDQVKTREFAAAMKALGVSKGLVVIEGPSRNLELSARNLPGVTVIRAEGLNVYDILRHDQLVVAKDALDKIADRVRS